MAEQWKEGAFLNYEVCLENSQPHLVSILAVPETLGRGGHREGDGFRRVGEMEAGDGSKVVDRGGTGHFDDGFQLEWNVRPQHHVSLFCPPLPVSTPCVLLLTAAIPALSNLN